MKRCILCVLLAATVVGRARSAAAEPAAPDAVDGGATAGALLDIHAWVDADLSLNVNRPPSHLNFTPGSGSTARTEGELEIDGAALDVQHAPDPVGAHLTLAIGDGMEVIRAAEPAPWHVLYQATVGWKAPLGRGLLVEAGIFPAHVGYETFFPKDNWNVTRGWLAELSPYYEAGVKATYAFSDQLTAQLHLLNGWSVIEDDNRAKSVGSSLTWSGALGSLAFNTIVGPELPRDDSHWRYFADLVGVLNATRAVSLAAQLDAGLQELANGGHSGWQGVAVFERTALGRRGAVAVRGEYFHDPDAVVAGVGQSLAEGTVTFEFRPAPPLILRVEGRYDHSTDRVFAAAGGPRNHQLLFVAGATAEF